MANHLWQSTLFALAAWLLTQALRHNRAAVRYWIWLAASLKFLLPFALLVTAGSQLHWRSALAIAPPQVAFLLDEIVTPPAVAHATPVSNSLPYFLFALWLCGVMIGVAYWLRWHRRLRAIRRAATPLPLRLPIPVMSSPARLEPGVIGIRNPVLLLPDGITGRLTPAQLQAVIAYELCHVHRRDNLTAALHMVVETIFWFHPLVWWIRLHLLEERERACDEEVLRASDPQIYAQGILNVCKLYLESPLVCVPGITGADLKHRIEAIVANRTTRRLNLARKSMLTFAGIAAIAGPVAIGVWNAPAIRAQATADRPEFEVASVKITPHGTGAFHMRPTPGGGLSAQNVGLSTFIQYAYGVKSYQLSGAPPWFSSETFDIEAKAPAGASSSNQRLMLQSLLAARFKLALHRESRDLPVYALEVAKGGPKLRAAKDADTDSSFRIGRGRIVAESAPLAELAGMLSGQTERPVVDRTGLTNKYDFSLEYTPGEGTRPPENPNEPIRNPDAVSIFEALQQQLGLRLVAARSAVRKSSSSTTSEKPAAN